MAGATGRRYKGGGPVGIGNGARGRSGMRLLIIEDNERLAALIQKGLEKVGFNSDIVTTATDAADALAASQNDIYGLSDDVGSNAVEVYVHRLRKRLTELGASVRIDTLRGLGYSISDAA